MQPKKVNKTKGSSLRGIKSAPVAAQVEHAGEIVQASECIAEQHIAVRIGARLRVSKGFPSRIALIGSLAFRVVTIRQTSRNARILKSN